MNTVETKQTPLQIEETKAVTQTELEFSVLSALIKCLFAEPGFSDVECSEIADLLDISIPTVKGVIGSLVKKGIVSVGEDQFAGLIYLNNDYWHLHPDWYVVQKRTIPVSVPEKSEWIAEKTGSIVSKATPGVIIATCNKPEDAQKIITAVNCHDELLDTLKKIQAAGQLAIHSGNEAVFGFLEHTLSLIDHTITKTPKA